MSLDALLAIDDRSLPRSEVEQLLADIDAWCQGNAIRPNEFGRMACDFGGFVGLMRRRCSARTRMAALARALMAAYPDGVRAEERELIRKTAFNMLFELRVPDPNRRLRPTNVAARHTSGATASFTGRDQPRVDRDPCPRCGTRGDVGCQHKPAGAHAL